VSPPIDFKNFDLDAAAAEVEDETIPRFEGSALRCPGCGETYLHHAHVSVWRRQEDEGVDELRFDSKSPEHAPDRIKRLASEFRSGRRHSLEISFRCETCGWDEPGPTLRIMQHKGQTLVEWI
jgi:predicted RNA-binding Zn-ribbon protein involved in translation (DUF1610 family)